MIYITQSALNDWLNQIAQQRILIAPVAEGSSMTYRQVSDSSEITGGFDRPDMGIKCAFLPATETLFTIQGGNGSYTITDNIPADEQVIFGVRPCDSRGMLALDALFIETEPVDIYYARRRQKSVIIGLACSTMGEYCFCTNLGSSPTDNQGADLFLTKSGSGYWLDIITEKGRNLFGTYAIQQSDPTHSRPLEIEHSANASLPDLEKWPPLFADEYWEAVGERCLSCRICAYVCPTCRCFDIRDETLPTAEDGAIYERIRCWDSCLGESYSQVAGGHNPRVAKGDRLRNRFYCKFYYFPQQHGPIACTGCGRCVEACPVNIDITEVLQHVLEATL